MVGNRNIGCRSCHDSSDASQPTMDYRYSVYICDDCHVSIEVFQFSGKLDQLQDNRGNIKEGEALL